MDFSRNVQKFCQGEGVSGCTVPAISFRASIPIPLEGFRANLQLLNKGKGNN
jgi:hypothetical protein